MIADRFVVDRRLGKGAFSTVLKAMDVHTSAPVAVKIDTSRKMCGTQTKEPLLAYEARVLRSLQGIPGVPNMVWFGKVQVGNEMMPAMGMQLLGEDLDSVLARSRLSARDAAVLGINLLFTIERMHDAGFIHRDLKPANILVDSGKAFISDFGLAKSYLTTDGTHIQYTDQKPGLTGTLRYCARHTHDRIESARRDDLESLLYIMIYGVHGHLPWMSPPKRSREDVGVIKKTIRPSSLCAGETQMLLPYATTVLNLNFYDRPNYSHLRKLLRDPVLGPTRDLAGVVDQ
jgi:serine/threonine protein kinase